MNDITIILWITIFIIAVIAIILVKLHFRGEELENDEGSILPSSESINNVLNAGRQTINSLGNNDKKPSNEPRSLSPQNSQQNTHNLFRRSEETSPKSDVYIIPEVEIEAMNSIEYESENQVLINYDNSVKKFQEPIKQSQMDIMTQNNKDTTELKDLFTIDELIKESKRKDSEREKESQTIKRDEDAELDELKESIKNKTEEPLIEEIINEDKQETIGDLIKETEESSETPSVASQKDVEEAISSASEESEEVIEISEDEGITESLLNQEIEDEIEEPALKTPSKVDEKDNTPSPVETTQWTWTTGKTWTNSQTKSKDPRFTKRLKKNWFRNLKKSKTLKPTSETSTNMTYTNQSSMKGTLTLMLITTNCMKWTMTKG